jgi:hypothetical protein
MNYPFTVLSWLTPVSSCGECNISKCFNWDKNLSCSLICSEGTLASLTGTFPMTCASSIARCSSVGSLLSSLEPEGLEGRLGIRILLGSFLGRLPTFYVSNVQILQCWKQGLCFPGAPWRNGEWAGAHWLLKEELWNSSSFPKWEGGKVCKE